MCFINVRMLIIKLFVKLIHFHFMTCMLFQIFCMIKNIITDDKWLWSWGDLQKILDFSRNSGCILKIMAPMNYLYLCVCVCVGGGGGGGGGTYEVEKPHVTSRVGVTRSVGKQTQQHNNICSWYIICKKIWQSNTCQYSQQHINNTAFLN